MWLHWLEQKESGRASAVYRHGGVGGMQCSDVSLGPPPPGRLPMRAVRRSCRGALRAGRKGVLAMNRGSRSRSPRSAASRRVHCAGAVAVGRRLYESRARAGHANPRSMKSCCCCILSAYALCSAAVCGHRDFAQLAGACSRRAAVISVPIGILAQLLGGRALRSWRWCRSCTVPRNVALALGTAMPGVLCGIAVALWSSRRRRRRPPFRRRNLIRLALARWIDPLLCSFRFLRLRACCSASC